MLLLLLITELLEIPTSCDSRLVDFRGDCSKRVLPSWTRAVVLAVKCALLWFFVVVCHTAGVSKLLYWAIGDIAMLDCSPLEFAMKFPMDENNRFCCKLKFNDFAPCLAENCFSALILVSDKTYRYTLWLTQNWKENINFSWKYNILKCVSSFWTTLYIIKICLK